MQVYTKILLGMLAGAIIGLTLGPASTFLEADTYKITDPSQLQLFVDRNDAATALQLPAGRPLRFHVVETIEGSVDVDGRSVPTTLWSKVEFTFDKRLALADASGALRARLGNSQVGERATVWLKHAHRISAAGVTTWPKAISGLGDTVISWMKPVGAAFMRLINMVIVPLVFASLLVGVASLGDIRKLGRVGGRTLALYMVTTAIAVAIGLVCAHVINPGSFVDPVSREALTSQFNADAGAKMAAAAQSPSAVDAILSIIPTNPVTSMTEGNMLQIIFFAVFLGVALTLIKESELVVRFFDSVQQAMIVVIHLVMKIAPFGVAALVAEVVGTSGWSVLKALLVYGVTVLIGLALHSALVYGGIVRLYARLPLSSFFRGIRPAQLIAFSTSSSSATLPVTMECAEERLGVSNSISSFVLPLGSTVNMDGTALYQGVAAVFIAQVFQTDLSFVTQLTIVGTATAASVGAAGVPGAGMVTLAMVLTTAGIPPVGVALILGMDRLLDMFRTTVNITGDLAVACAMAVAEGETLELREPQKLAPDSN